MGLLKAASFKILDATRCEIMCIWYLFSSWRQKCDQTESHACICQCLWIQRWPVYKDSWLMMFDVQKFCDWMQSDNRRPPNCRSSESRSPHSRPASGVFPESKRGRLKRGGETLIMAVCYTSGAHVWHASHTGLAIIASALMNFTHHPEWVNHGLGSAANKPPLWPFGGRHTAETCGQHSWTKARISGLTATCGCCRVKNGRITCRSTGWEVSLTSWAHETQCITGIQKSFYSYILPVLELKGLYPGDNVPLTELAHLFISICRFLSDGCLQCTSALSLQSSICTPDYVDAHLLILFNLFWWWKMLHLDFM